MNEKQIIYYIKENGKCPCKEWFCKLDKINQYKVQLRLNRIQAGSLGEHKQLKNNLNEFKFKNGLRIYYYETEHQILLLLTGGNKTRQSNDIKKALEFLNDYNQRSLKNE